MPADHAVSAQSALSAPVEAEPVDPTVVSVSRDGSHRMSKPVQPTIELIAGLGVAGDAHLGVTVQHLSRIRRDPAAPNLRQVHLIQRELLDLLRAQGYQVGPGRLGENITTRGLDLLDLPTRSRLGFTGGALIEVTGLRNPCLQLDGLQDGLMRAVLDRGPDGELIRKAGVMAVVLTGGTVGPGSAITVTEPLGDPVRLGPV